MRTIVCLGLIVALMNWSCTKQTRLEDVDFDELDGSGARVYRIEMSNGDTYVIKRFEMTGDRIKVVEVDRMPGTYDSDGQPDPRSTFWINVDEIVRDKAATGISVGLIVVGAAAVLGMIALGQAFGDLD